MKKLIITVYCMLGVFITAGAQEQTEQTPANNTQYLPSAGDFALGIDATPFLQYFGNMFNGSLANTAPFANGYQGTIYGKYFLEDNRAIRARLRLNFSNKAFSATVPNDTERAQNPLNTTATVIDSRTERIQDVDLMVGYEFRRGKGRIQGFYGGEVGFGYSGGSTKYEYGNLMTAANQNPTTVTNWTTGATASSARRATEVTNGKTLRGTLAGFVGVEYFIASQLSLGAEFNLSVIFSRTGQNETTVEGFDAAANQVITQPSRQFVPNYPTAPSNQFSVATVPQGAIFLMFHF